MRCYSNLEVFCLFCLETGSHMAGYVGLELKILLPQSLECWNYRPCRGNLKAGLVSYVQEHLTQGR